MPAVIVSGASYEKSFATIVYTAGVAATVAAVTAVVSADFR